MKKEKKLLKIINVASDWIIKIIMINLLIISTSLLIVTFVHSLQAGYKLLKDYVNKDEVKLIRTYFKYFKENFLNKIFLSLIALSTIVLIVISNIYYQNAIKETPTLMSYFGFITTLIVGFVIIISTLYVPVVLTSIENITVEETVKISFFLSVKYIFRSIAMVIIFLIPGLLMMSSLTMLLLVFCGISLPLLSVVILAEKPANYLLLSKEHKDEIRD
ncbi:DUF624 domain-containing protein [Haploplasma modicum]|uniref:DUF624 domain-containing protein n=1 Tax=Haploplasma modicum TaxID=2150 RepID=UPI00214C9B85|nr:DUF624 domain-containing protein [Haploplasma modicum]MCR1809365.1 DUF624 domain-containing protein [Haploplasma modicum]